MSDEDQQGAFHEAETVTDAVAPDAEVAGDAVEPTDETEVEEVAPVEEAPEEIPEPTPVGHGIIQDNVTEPGVQHTGTPDGVVTSSAQTVEDAPVDLDEYDDTPDTDG